MITPVLYRKLAPAFAKHARYHAPHWGVDADDFEQWMWEVLLAKGAGVVHKCGPLFSQSPAYVATWAARYAIKRVQREWRAESLDESLTYTPSAYSESFSEYLARIGSEWGIDVSQALAVIEGHEVSPEFEQYIRELGPQDKRIAALLLSGLRRSHIESAKLAPRRKTQEIHQQLYQILKAA